MPNFFVDLWSNFQSWFYEYVILTFDEKFGPNAVLDILVLSCFFYFIYRFARRRRAMRLVMGVVLFLLIMFIGDAIQMTALKFVFGNFKQLGVVAILILFQPEFRSALEKIGGTTFMGIQNMNHDKKDDVSAHYVVESVSRAAQRLSAMGHGALIVIERVNGLSEYKRTGTTIDAVISPDLLCSIFYKGGALHDGAVIVSDGKIDSAGCVLRVTDRVDIDSSLGTRHRAAIGTSEVCDAVVVVVSEETCTISLSIDGNLERDFNYSSLRKRLEELLIPEVKEKRTSAAKSKKNKKVKTNHANNASK